MHGLNAVGLVFFGCINILAHRLCACPEKKRRKGVAALCALLLSFNLIRYAFVYPFIDGAVLLPVEFSTVAYFLVPLILLASIKGLRSWAAYSGLMAGFFYYMAAIFAGGPIYCSYPPDDIYISLFCHGALYLCGFVTIGTERFSAKDAPKLAAGVALVASHAALLRPLVAGDDRMLIYMLLDAAVIRRFFPQAAWAFALPAYYISVALLVVMTIRGFFRKNRRLYCEFLIS